MSSSENITKANNDQDVACPVCGEIHSVDSICPKCAFECHLTMTELMYERFKDIETDRIIKHQNWWLKLQSEIVELKKDVLKKNAQIQSLTDINNSLSSDNEKLSNELEKIKDEIKNKKSAKPIGFLVTERFVVYCLIEGVNTFGSSKNNPDCDQHQKIIIPGHKLKPIHFSIVVSKVDNNYIYTLNEIDSKPRSIFVNSLHEEMFDAFHLSDDDNILISYTMNGKDNYQEDYLPKLKFRKQII